MAKILSLPGRTTEGAANAGRIAAVKALWDKIRPTQNSREECLRYLAYSFETERTRVNPDAPRIPLDLLIEWEAAGGWEAAYQAHLLETLLTSPSLSPTERLKNVVAAVEQARGEMVSARNEISNLPADSSRDEVRIASERARVTYARWYELQKHVREVEDEVRRREVESSRKLEAQQERERIENDLLAQYEDAGPQYELLIRRLASLEVRLRQAESSGRDIASSEYAELHRQHLAFTNQLQKYTESLKSESITKQTQETVLAVLAVAERIISPSNPALWGEVVRAVKIQVELGGEAA